MKTLMYTLFMIAALSVYTCIIISIAEYKTKQAQVITTQAPDTPQEPTSQIWRVTGIGGLLDAIEQVESGGDANAVGDIERYDIGGWSYFPTVWTEEEKANISQDHSMPEYNGWICVPGYPAVKLLPDKDPNDGLFNAEIANAVGSFQIWTIYVDDVNRITGKVRKTEYGDYPYYRYFDRWCPKKSREMARIYLKHYATKKRLGRKPTFEDMARIHNGGPDGWKKESTKPYWNKIKVVLYE